MKHKQSHAEPLTRETLQAAFEYGGADAAWNYVELDRERSIAVGRELEIKRMRERSDRFAWLGYPVATIGVVCLFVGLLWLISWANGAGDRERDAAVKTCQSGDTVACISLVQDSKNMEGHDTNDTKLFRTVYKLKTGHDLPEVK